LFRQKDSSTNLALLVPLRGDLLVTQIFIILCVFVQYTNTDEKSIDYILGKLG